MSAFATAVNEERLVNTFLELVRIDSETKYEGKICAHLKQVFTALGLDVMEDDTARITGHEAGNLIANAAPNTAEDVPPIHFVVHMDTVAPGNGVQPIIENGYIRSDGTTVLGSDNKAGIAAVIEAIRVLRKQKYTHGPLQVIITSGEESGLLGAKALDPTYLYSHYGFALDSTGPVGDVVVRAPYQAKLHTTVYGRSAHAGLHPEKGISAIQVAGKAIAKMPLGRIDEDTTANIGRFEGGGATNVVCEQADIFAEARSLEVDKLDAQIKRMSSAFEDVAHQHGATVQFKEELVYPGYNYTETDELVQIACRALERIGCRPRLLSSGGGSDANILSGYGVPTVNFGIGYENIHTKAEQMPISELVKAAQLVISLALQTCNG